MAIPMPTNGVVPAGHTEYDGSTHLKADMPDLWAFLAEDTNVDYEVDSTHFSVPDMRGNVLVGLSSAGAFATYIGDTVGAETHTHPLSDNGGALLYPDADGIVLRRISGTGGDWSGNFSIAGTRSSGTYARSGSVALGGVTDAGSSIQPSFIVRWITRYEGVTLAPAGTTASTSATADTVAQRTADARIKAADGVAADDVATMSQLPADTGWVPLTLGAGWSGLGTPAWKRVGSTVSFKGEIYGGALDTTILTLPAEARPVERIHALVSRLASVYENPGLLRIQTSGELSVRWHNGSSASPGLGLGTISYEAV